jgi:hypothetical protein
MKLYFIVEGGGGSSSSWRRSALAAGGRRFVLLRWSRQAGAGALVGQASGTARLVGEQILDLGVDAAKVIVGPSAQRLEEAGIKSQ